MRRYLFVTLFGVVLVILVGLLVTCGDALTSDTGAVSASPSPSATPTATPPPVVVPAPAAVVHRALAQRRLAVRAWTKWNRARWCESLKHLPFASPKPRRSADAAHWQAAGRHWRHMRARFHRKTGRLVHRMTHPGGPSSGVRWLPLARYVGWPSYTLSHLAYIIQRESSGRPNAYNGVIGCTGLLQIWPGNVSQPWRLREPVYNLSQGLRLYRQCGWGPWGQ